MIPGLGRSLQKGKATHSSILAWRIPWTTVHGVTNSQTRLSDFHFHFTRKFRFPTPFDQVGLNSQKAIKSSYPSRGCSGGPVLPKLPTPLLFYPCPGTRTCLAAMVVCICSLPSGISCTQASLKPGKQESRASHSLSIAMSVYVLTCSVMSDSLQPHGL